MNKNGTLTVIGLGCGGADLLTPQAAEALRAADIVFVTPNYRHLVECHPNIFVMENLSRSLGEIESALAAGRDAAVGVSGDPGIFSYTATLRERFGEVPGLAFRVVPGVGSLSLFFAKLGENWHDANILSGHGRGLTEQKLMRVIQHNRKTVVFCDKTRNPAWVCAAAARFERDFREPGASPLRVAVGENLSLEDERVSYPFEINGPKGAALPGDVPAFSDHALAAVFNDEPAPPFPPRPHDDAFLKTTVPMTRQEVRSVILDELRLSSASVVWDVGAGTGSVAIACAALCPDGEVHAIERQPEAVELIRRNRKKFGSVNLEIHPGAAPEAFAALPAPTHVFIGGSGGRLPEILRHIAGLGPGIRVCVSAVTLETIADVSRVMARAGMFRDLEVTQISVSRSKPLGGSRLMAAQNPVTLWTAVTDGRE